MCVDREQGLPGVETRSRAHYINDDEAFYVVLVCHQAGIQTALLLSVAPFSEDHALSGE